MFSTTVTNAHVTVFGNVQGCVVKVVVTGFALALPHLMSRERLARFASSRRCRSACQRWLADVARGAARLLGMSIPAITAYALCRQPVLLQQQQACVRS